MTGSFFSKVAEIIGGKGTREGVLPLSGVDCAIGTTVGATRHDNQDRAIVARGEFASVGSQFLLFAVADGLGGMRNGGECAQETLASILEGLVFSRERELDQRLKSALSIANHRVHSRHKGEGGSTASVVLVEKNGGIAIGNVGDSRIYRFLPRNRPSLLQLTLDDTIGAQLQQFSKQYVSEEFPSEYARLVQFVGIGEEMRPHVEVQHRSPEDGYLLRPEPELSSSLKQSPFLI